MHSRIRLRCNPFASPDGKMCGAVAFRPDNAVIKTRKILFSGYAPKAMKPHDLFIRCARWTGDGNARAGCADDGRVVAAARSSAGDGTGARALAHLVDINAVAGFDRLRSRTANLRSLRACAMPLFQRRSPKGRSARCHASVVRHRSLSDTRSAERFTAAWQMPTRLQWCVVRQRWARK